MTLTGRKLVISTTSLFPNPLRPIPAAGLRQLDSICANWVAHHTTYYCKLGVELTLTTEDQLILEQH